MAQGHHITHGEITAERMQCALEAQALCVLRDMLSNGSSSPSCTLRISSIQQLALVAYFTGQSTGKIFTTERDLYYTMKSRACCSRHPLLLFPTQAAVSGAIRHLCRDLSSHHPTNHALQHEQLSCSAIVTREALGITATAKSTVSGRFTFEMNCDGKRTLVDVDALGGRFALSSADVGSSDAFRFPLGRPTRVTILVIEKESIRNYVLFREDIVQRAHPSHPLVVLCTKGFPCHASRCFLQRLSLGIAVEPDGKAGAGSSRIPVEVQCMTDGDVFGIHIVWCLVRTPTDDATWYRELRKSRAGAAPVIAYLEAHRRNASVVWDNFLACCCVMSCTRHIGLTAEQANAAGISMDSLHHVECNERRRGERLLSELATVEAVVCGCLKVDDPVTSALRGGCVRFLQECGARLTSILRHNRKAELQALLERLTATCSQKLPDGCGHSPPSLYRKLVENGGVNEQPKG